VFVGWCLWVGVCVVVWFALAIVYHSHPHTHIKKNKKFDFVKNNLLF